MLQQTHSPHDGKSQLLKYADKDFRPHQAEAIEYILGSEAKIVVMDASTGAGKSLISMVSGVCNGGVTYMVHSKILQNQITVDFPEAVSLFGRSNYRCINNPMLDCSECTHSLSSPCINKKNCLYEKQKTTTLAARLKILNYDYWLSECNYVGRFCGASLVVIDEADNLENTLIDFTTLVFTKYAIKQLGLTDLAGKLQKTSKFKDQLLVSWQSFGNIAITRLRDIIDDLTAEIKSLGNDANITGEQLDLIKTKSRMVRLEEKIALFLSNVSSDWILDDSQDGKLIWRPLWLTPELADQVLWRHGEKFVLMSALFPPKQILAKTLGFDVADADFYSLPSLFPVDNRPVYVYPAANMTAKTAGLETPKLISAISQITASRPKVKGIIHAVSYKLANAIVDGLNSPRFITHNSDNRQEAIDKFLATDKPLILVSPSLERGISLEEDKCRLIIIAKAPYLSLGDRIVSARLYSGRLGQEHYAATMMLTVLQMAGRAVRSDSDYAETFILDAQFLQALTRRPSFLPDWFKDAINFDLPEDLKEICRKI